MTTWWADNHPRLKQEKAAVAALQEREPWLENVEWSLDIFFRLQAVFDIRLDHGVFTLVMTYHNTFPSSPPDVAPVDSTRLSSHQYGRAVLCLEIRPDNWRQEFTGADMIESAYNLLTIEAPDEEGNAQQAPSAHDVPDTITSRSAVYRFYNSPEINMVILEKAPNQAIAKIYVLWSGVRYAVAHLASIEHGDWTWKAKLIPAALREEALFYTGSIIRTDKKYSDFKGVKTEDDLQNILDLQIDTQEASWACFVVTSDQKIILFRKIQNVEDLIRHRTINAPTQGIRRSGEEYEKLAGLRVGIVGLGSVGAKVAVSLARAGIKRFELIDDDILHTGNLERHDVDWRDVCLHKVDAVSRRLRLIASDIEVSERRTYLGAQISTNEAGNVDTVLHSCDLLVDATANPKVLNHLTGIVLSSNKTIVWGGVYAGGIGGYIARSRPNVDPDPFLIRDSLNEFYNGIDIPPPVPDPEGYDGRDETDVLIASDADVSVIASHLVSLALDDLLQRMPSQFSDHAYIIGLRRAWIFESAFDVRPITVNAPTRDTISPPESDPVEQEFMNNLIANKLNEVESQ